MRRTVSFAVLMMTLCLLCACGGKQNEVFQAPMDFRADFLAKGSCRFTAAGTAEVEQRLYEMTLGCTCRSDGTAEIRICEPESIAGVEAETDGRTGKILYDGMSLAFGVPCDDRLAPAAMPAVLCHAWAEGYILSAGQDETGLLAVYDFGADDPVNVRTWFDEEGLPIRAEFVWMGRVCGRLEITDFELISGGNYEAAEEDLG